MLNRRKSVIGYLTYIIAMRVVRKAVRDRISPPSRAERVRRGVSATARDRSRALPIAGAAVAAAAGLALLARARRGGDESAEE